MDATLIYQTSFTNEQFGVPVIVDDEGDIDQIMDTLSNNLHTKNKITVIGHNTICTVPIRKWFKKDNVWLLANLTAVRREPA